MSLGSPCTITHVHVPNSVFHRSQVVKMLMTNINPCQQSFHVFNIALPSVGVVAVVTYEAVDVIDAVEVGIRDGPASNTKNSLYAQCTCEGI